MQRLSRRVLVGLVGGVLTASLITGPSAVGDPTQPSDTPSATGSPSASASPSPTPSPAEDPPGDGSTAATGRPSPTATATNSSATTGQDSTDETQRTENTRKTQAANKAEKTRTGDADTTKAETGTAPKATVSKKITLKVAAKGTPIKGRFFQGIGSYAFSGTLAPTKKHQRVEIWWSGGTVWKRFTHTYTDTGNWSVSKVVVGPGARYFYATLGDHAPTSAGTIHSPKVKINIEKTSLKITAKSSIDSLTSTTVSGTVWPVRPNVKVHFQVKSATSYQDEGVARSDSKGRVSFTFSTGKGELKTYRLRTRYWIYRSQAWRNSPSIAVKRARVLNAKVTKTTAAEVAKTWHKGCPVGRSQLRTIKMNYEDFSHKMHRGIMIVRSDRTDAVIASFGKNLGKPIRRMDNPNVWNGNDPKQMEADNTSAFNCRKVTGNPYAQSPHSYGIAIDVNTRENPYRDVSGKWWPKSGKKYIKRSPWKVGMLNTKSVLTKQLRSRGYFWGGFWNPGRDYQHFEYDK